MLALKGQTSLLIEGVCPYLGEVCSNKCNQRRFKMKSVVLIFLIFALTSCSDNGDDNEGVSVSGTTPKTSDPKSDTDPHMEAGEVTQEASEETFTITNETFFNVQISTGYFSQKISREECVVLTRSQFAALKVGLKSLWNQRLVCDSAQNDKKCPAPNNYHVKQNWSVKMFPADKKAENCKSLE